MNKSQEIPEQYPRKSYRKGRRRREPDPARPEALQPAQQQPRPRQNHSATRLEFLNRWWWLVTLAGIPHRVPPECPTQLLWTVGLYSGWVHYTRVTNGNDQLFGFRSFHGRIGPGRSPPRKRCLHCRPALQIRWRVGVSAHPVDAAPHRTGSRPTIPTTFQGPPFIR